MGVLHNISIRIFLMGSIVLVAGAALAEDALPTDAPASDPPQAEAPVSMSPSLFEDAVQSFDSEATVSAHPLPLTRAAAKQRVNEMSPVGWLASFGPVVVGNNQP